MNKKKIFIGILLLIITVSVINRITKCSEEKNFKPKTTLNNSTVEVKPLSILKASEVIKVKNLELNFKNIKISDKYIFDRFGSRFMYRQAKRDLQYIVADLLITSEIKEPHLPSVVLYYQKGEKLNMLGQLEYNFYSWSDYGTYLGNYQDTNNDFNYTKTIKFSLAIDVDEKIIKDNKLYLVVFDNEGFVRMFQKFRQPEIFYKWAGKKNIPATLIANDFNANIQLVKILN